MIDEEAIIGWGGEDLLGGRQLGRLWEPDVGGDPEVGDEPDEENPEVANVGLVIKAEFGNPELPNVGLVIDAEDGNPELLYDGRYVC